MDSQKNLTLVLPFVLSLSALILLLLTLTSSLPAYADPSMLYACVDSASDETPIHTNSPHLRKSTRALATVVSGSISGTWTAAGSPYTVTSDLVITASDALTIQPGVEVRFAGSYRLIVYGDLLANGTVTAPITFTSHLVSPQPGDWLGIQFHNSGNNDRLSHVRVEFAATGIKVEAEHGTASPTIEHSLITNSLDDGISISADAGTGDAYARPEILSSTISFNGGRGIYVYGRGGSDDYDDGYAEPTIRNSAISNNHYGIFLYGLGGSDNNADGYAEGNIISNTITGNGLDGIHLYGKGGNHRGSLFNPDGHAEGDIISNTIIGNGRFGIYLLAEGNHSSFCDPGLDCNGFASPNIIGNVIANNNSTGILIQADGQQDWPFPTNNKGYASPLVANNIIANNHGHGLCTTANDQFDQVRPKVIHNTIVSNTVAGIQGANQVYSSAFKIYNNLIVSNATGLAAYEGEIPDVRYNDLWGNVTDFSNYPSSYGVTATTNANGDPSDPYYKSFWIRVL